MPRRFKRKKREFAMKTDYYNTVLTYGLTKEENGRLKEHTNFVFEDVSDCFPDLLARNPVAIILNPEWLSKDELEQLIAVYSVGDILHLELSGAAENLNKRCVAVDIETTGFSAASDKIIEIGAVKIENGKIVDEFRQLINPGRPIPPRITEMTGITADMVKEQPSIEEALPHFLAFCAGCAIIAHNAKFDMGFIKYNTAKQGLDYDFQITDTLEIARRLFPDLENHRLDTVANHLDVELLEHHRAADDARATAHIFLKCAELQRALAELVDAHHPLFIFTSPVTDLPDGFYCKICAVSDEQEIADFLKLAERCRDAKNQGEYPAAQTGSDHQSALPEISPK